MTNPQEQTGVVRTEQSLRSAEEDLKSSCKYIIESDRSSTRRKEVLRIKDEMGNALCRAERPSNFAKTWSFVGFLFTLSFALLLIASRDEHSTSINFTLGGICLTALVSLALVLLKPRNLTIYQGEVGSEAVVPLIYIKLSRRFVGTYVIETVTGECLGCMRCSGGRFFRAKLECYRPNGSLSCAIVETVSTSTLIWHLIGVALGGSAYRINRRFRVVEPTESRVIGEFSDHTISVDSEAHIDGRICLAMGVMLHSACSVV